MALFEPMHVIAMREYLLLQQFVLDEPPQSPLVAVEEGSRDLSSGLVKRASSASSGQRSSRISRIGTRNRVGTWEPLDLTQSGSWNRMVNSKQLEFSISQGFDEGRGEDADRPGCEFQCCHRAQFRPTGAKP